MRLPSEYRDRTAEPFDVVRRNFVANAGDIALYSLAMGFASIVTTIPVYLRHLTDSKLVLGLVPAVVDTGFLLPQLFTAPLVHRLTRKKPLVLVLGLIHRLPFLGFAVVIWGLSDLSNTVKLVAFFGILFWLGASGGLVATPWLEMVAKVVPVDRRGRMFGTGHAVGGLLGIGGGIAARELLVRFPYPQNFAYCFLAAFVCVMASYACLASVVEHDEPSAAHVADGWAYWRNLPAVLRRDKNFVRFLLVTGLANFGAMANGIYAVAGVQRFNLGDEQAGWFTAVLGLGILSNFLWGNVGDRHGHKHTFQIGLVSIIVALGLAAWAPTPAIYRLVFLFLGVGSAALIVSSNTIVAEFGQVAGQRPTYIGLNSTIRAPIIGLAPILGGWLAERVGFSAVFLVSMVPVALGLVGLYFGVEDPRHAQG